jgi:hypothetical protein
VKSAPHPFFSLVFALSNHKIAASPFLSTRLKSFREGPLGRFSPISHFCTVERLVFSTDANTAWLTCSFSRNNLILSGVISEMLGVVNASNSFIRRLSISPILCNPDAVSFISLAILFVIFFDLMDHLHKFTLGKGQIHLLVIKIEKIYGHFLKDFQFLVTDIVSLVFLESVEKDPAVNLLGRHNPGTRSPELL